MVAVLDQDNPAGAKGHLTLDDLEQLPHAISAFKGNPQTPADRTLGEMQLTRQELVRTNGYLPLPFVVVGSQAVALIPSRLARRFTKAPRLRFLPLPHGIEAPLHEAMWWHPSHETDPAHQWMIRILRAIGEDLRQVPTGL
jgi:DNA-binding transcriptional LysR family regulator